MTPDSAAGAENAAIALDAYERHVLGDSAISHRDSPVVADALVRGLLKDLLHYADKRLIDFPTVLVDAMETQILEVNEERAAANALRIGAEVQLRPDTASKGPVGPPASGSDAARGYVIAVDGPENEDPGCTVRFPGVPAGELHLPASSLEPAPAFPLTVTNRATVTSAADAEDTLVTVAARILRDVHAGRTADADDLADRDRLAGTLAMWAGSTGERVLLCVATKVNRAASRMTIPLSEPDSGLPGQEPTAPEPAEPVRLAATDFPYDINNGVPDQSTATSTSPAERLRAILPNRRGPNRRGPNR